MSAHRFTGHKLRDELFHSLLDREKSRERSRGRIKATLRVGHLALDDLKALGADLLVIAALRDVERVVLPELLEEQAEREAAAPERHDAL